MAVERVIDSSGFNGHRKFVRARERNINLRKAGAALLAIGALLIAIYVVKQSHPMAGFEADKAQSGRTVASLLVLLNEHSSRLPPLTGGMLKRQGETFPQVVLDVTELEDDRLMVTLELDGYSGDSVRGERWRWIVQKGEGTSMTVLAKGAQIKCWRGWNADKWMSGGFCS